MTPPSSRTSARRNGLLLAALWLAHAVAAIIWLRLDQRFPTGDAARTLTASLRVADTLRHPSLDLASRLTAAAAGQSPLPHLVAAPVVWLLGRGADTLTALNLLWLALLMLGVYGLMAWLLPVQPGRIAWRSLAAAAVVSLYPLSAVAAHTTLALLPSAALAAGAVWLLVQSAGFSRLRYALGFALAAVAGQMTTAHFWVVLLIPTAAAALQALLTPRPPRGSYRTPSRNPLQKLARRLRLAPAHLHLLLSLLLAALLALVYARTLAPQPVAAAASPLSLLGRLDDAVGLPLLLALLAAALAALWQVLRPTSPQARLDFALPLLWLISLLALLPLFSRAPRSVDWFPLLPAAALLTVAGGAALLAAGNRQTRRILGAGMTAVLLAAAVQVIVLSWSAGAAEQASAPFTVNAPFASLGQVNAWPPQSQKSQTAAIGQSAARLCPDAATCRVATASCQPPLNAPAFGYFLAQAQLDQRLSLAPLTAAPDFYTDLWNADFLVSSTAVPQCSDEALSAAIATVQGAQDSTAFKAHFHNAGDFPLPDGSTATLWQRTQPPLAELDAAEQIVALEHILSITPASATAAAQLNTALAADGDPARALNLRQQAAARTPDDPAAQLSLADAYAGYGRLSEAAEHYRRAVALAPTPAALLRWSSVLEQLGETRQAEEALTSAVTLAPTDYTVRLQQGRFYTTRSQFADATAALAEARSLDPTRYETYLALAQSQLTRGDTQQADEQFRLAAEAAPQAAEPHLAWGEALAAQGNRAAAAEQFNQAITLAEQSGSAPAQINATGRWIATLAAQGQADQAQELADALQQRYPNNPAALAVQGDLLLRQGLWPEATAVYSRTVQLAPLDSDARLGLVQALSASGRQIEATAVITAGLALPAGPAELHTAHGDLLLAADPAAAYQAYQAALAANPAYWRAAEGLARLALQQGQAAQALNALDSSLQRWPQEYRLHARRGDALSALGRRQSAIAAYRRALELAPAAVFAGDPIHSLRARLHTALADQLLATGAFDAARSSYQRALAEDNTLPAASVGLAQLYTELARRAANSRGSTVADDAERFELAEQALRRALALQPDNAAAQRAQGDLYAAYGQTEQAIAAYQQAIETDPDGSIATMQRLNALYLTANQTQTALDFFRNLLRLHPDSVAALRGLTAAQVAAGQPTEALAAFDLFLVQHRNDAQALVAQGDLLRTLGETEQALTAYSQAARLARSSGWVQPAIAEAHTLLLLGRSAEAEAIYTDLISRSQDAVQAAALNGNLAQAYSDLVQLYRQQDRDEAARALLDAALVQQPNEATLYLLAGDLSRADGQNAAALAAYRQALALEPDNSQAQVRLGNLYLNNGDATQAQSAFEAALAADPTLTTAVIGLGNSISRQVDADQPTPAQSVLISRTLQLLDGAVSEQPTQTATLQRLRGDLLALQARPEEAAAAYETALLAAPDDTAAIEGLARTLLAGGRADEALASYQDAAAAALTPAERTRWLMAAAAAQRGLGRNAAAEQSYQALLTQDPANTVARRALADLYLADERLEEAVAQYRLLLAANTNDLNAAAQLARLLLRLGQTDEARTLSTELLRRSPSAYQSSLLAARLAQADGDPVAALTALRQAEAAAATNAGALVQTGDLYLALGRSDDAGTVYTAALTLEPRNANALVGLARIALNRGNTAEAERLLNRALAAAPLNPAARAAYGALLLRSDRAAAAIPLLAELAASPSATPAALQDLAAAYLATGEVEEGLAIYRTRLGLSAAEQPLRIGQALVQAGLFTQGIAALLQYTEENPGQTAGLLALAEAYTAAGENDQADAVYQQAVTAAPQDLTLPILYGNFLLSRQQSTAAATRFAAVIGELERADRLNEVQQPTAEGQPAELWQAWIGLARAQQQQGDFELARQAVEAGAALRPDLAAFPLQLGDSLRALERNDEALAAYTRAAELGSVSAAQVRRGDLLLALGRADDALTAYEAALAVSPDNGDALIGLAQAYALRGGGRDEDDFANAETRLRRAAQLNPDAPAVALALGDLYSAYGRSGQAVTAYRQALAAAPDNTQAADRLVTALLADGQAEAALTLQQQRLKAAPQERPLQLRLAAIYRALNRAADAEAVYAELLRQTPDDAVVLVAAGDLALAEGDSSQAITRYQDALTHSTSPTLSAQAAEQLGKAYLQADRAAEALTLAQKQLSRYPELARSYLLLGSVYEATGDTEAALAAYSNGIATASDDRTALQLRQADLALRRGEAATAQTLYEALTAAQPRNSTAFIGLARAHIAQLPDLASLRTEWAEQALRTALRLEPNSVAALSAQGDLYAARERWTEAVAAYHQALAVQGTEGSVALHRRLAEALAAAGDAAGAVQERQRLVAANPADIAAQMALGNAYAAAGRNDAALAQFRLINRLQPDYPYAYIKQGELLDASNQTEAALAAYRAAVAAAPGNADAVFTLASVYRKRGLISEAIAAYEAGLTLDPARDAARGALEALRLQESSQP